jgi:hypothetical protein
MLRPFIVRDSELLLSAVPTNYMEKLEHVSATWKRAKASLDVYQKSFENAEPPGSGAPPPDGTVFVSVPTKDRAEKPVGGSPSNGE